MIVSVGKSVLVFSVLFCFGCSDGHQEVIQAAAVAEKKDINHGCPSWFLPISNTSNRCECGKPIHHPARVVYCNPYTNQTRVLLGHCMDYYYAENEMVVIGLCPYGGQKDTVQGLYVEPPQNVTELNDFLCSGLNRTGLMCSHCQAGLGTPILSFSIQCLPCMSSGFGWTLYVFLATFPTTVLFLVVLIFQLRITSGSLNAYIFVCQLLVSTVNSSRIAFQSILPFNRVFLVTIFTIYGVWNLDFLRYFLPSFCASEQLGTIHVAALEYVVAFYPLLLTIIAYVCIQLYARGCQIIVCLWRVFCKCFSCFRRRWGGQWDPAASLVHTFAAFLLLSYSKITSVSLKLLNFTPLYIPTGGTIDTPMRVYLNPSLEWFGVEHLPFAILAIFILCIFVLLPALFLLLYPMRIFQKCLGCCGRRLLVLHAFADVFQGCYKNGTNGTTDCRYFAGLYLVLRMVLVLVLPNGSVFGFYNPMIAIVCLVIASLLFLFYRPYRGRSWLNVWDAAVFSLLAFAILCYGYTRYIAPVPLEITGAIFLLPLVYSVIYVIYKLLAWIKSLWICKKRNSGRLRLKSQEPDRLANPNEYKHDERLKLLPPPDQEDECPRNFDTETYPACGNSQRNYGSVN